MEKNNFKIINLGHMEVVDDPNIIYEVINKSPNMISDQNEAIDMCLFLNKIDRKKHALLVSVNNELNEKPSMFAAYDECYIRLRDLYIDIALTCGIQRMNYFNKLPITVKTGVFMELIQQYNSALLREDKTAIEFYSNNLKQIVSRFFNNSYSLSRNINIRTALGTSNSLTTFYHFLVNNYAEHGVIQVLRLVYKYCILALNMHNLTNTYFMTLDSRHVKYSTSNTLYNLYMISHFKK